ncbi:large proline-rich protein bag6-B [Cinnamomum micranthum f. kanehirae]|uniref:Large proline-rich protein bag6-B n=1 Tax=Cinnamomum micranthum f. kanehirae TaxID=337451 RepID=A0A3S3P3D3_9MAGN|nr:large proline-rich protein bag6-B [Cinnamomum micranthum f. kanehirae]
MADGSSSEVTSSSQDNAESSESTVAVNVKTLDSQIYTFRVNQNMPVSLFKEKIASAVGLPVGQQRLIFRGKVLKDDHLLSEYHLEDGHTLHLVVRQPVQSQTSSGTSSGESNGNHDNQGNDSAPGAPHNRVGHVSHSVLLGTLNVRDQVEGIVPDLSRIIGAVLNSFGIGNLVTAAGSGNTSSGNAVNTTTQPDQGIETEGAQENAGSRSQGQPAQPFFNLPFQALHGMVAVPSLQMVIPDSLTTLSEFINRMELALSPNGNSTPSSLANVREPRQEFSSSIARGLPTPEVLVTVMRQAQQLLSGPASAALLGIAGHLEREGNTSDTVTRGQIQAEAMQVGVVMQHLGSLLLELGRTIQTLRMGQSPAESVINAGPAVYISPSGPNPIMVQPSPFQTNTPFGISSTVRPVSNPGIPVPIGQGEVPRHINIHIHAGTSVAPGVSSVGASVNTGETATANVGPHPTQAPGTNNGTGSASVPRRVLPVRSVVAAVPTRSPAEAASHFLNAFYPLNARSQQTAPSNSVSSQGSSLAASDRDQLSSGSFSQNSQSISLPAVMAPVHAHVGNVVGNIQGESLSGSALGIADRLHAGEGVQVPSGPLETTNNPTLGALSSESKAQPGEKTTTTVASEHTSSSSLGPEPPQGGRDIPLGLGSGGLQPKMQRRSKQVKSLGKDDGVGTSLPVTQNQNQESISRGQQVLQSLFSGGDNINRTDTNGQSVQMPPLIGQIMNGMPLGGQGANGQIDVANMMSQVLQSPAMNSLLAGVSEQAGVGSPAGLRSILEQLTQSPSMRNTLGQIAEEVGGQRQELGNLFSGLGGDQGGINFSRMFQQLMPVVSQVLSQGPVTETSRGMESDIQSSNGNNAGNCSQADGNISQTDLRQADQLEGHDLPSNVFRAVVENASHLYGEGNTDLIEEICSNDTLANEFMEMLQRDVHLRCQSEPRSSNDKS